MRNEIPNKFTNTLQAALHLSISASKNHFMTSYHQWILSSVAKAISTNISRHSRLALFEEDQLHSRGFTLTYRSESIST